MRISFVLAATAALSIAAGAALPAHHSFAAEFDAEKPIQLRGTVVRVEWINPHTWIHIDVKEPDGKVARWMIEGGTPNTLLRRGLTRDTLPAGTEIGRDTSLLSTIPNNAKLTLPLLMSSMPARRKSNPFFADSRA